MIWEKDKPLFPGYYWLRGRYLDPEEIEIVSVEQHQGGGLGLVVRFTGYEASEDIESVLGEWAGPIPKPNGDVSNMEVSFFVASAMRYMHGYIKDNERNRES